MRAASTIAVAAALALACQAPAQAAPVKERISVATSLPGVTLNADVVRPEGDAKAGILLTLTPYAALGGAVAPGLNSADDSLAARWVPEGYARVVADVPGTNGSSGCWDYGGRNEQQAGVDLVNALAKLPWANGRVVMIGTSYDGTTANMVAARGADVPGLAGIVPIAAISRWYGYAFQDGVRYAGNTKEPADEGADTPLAFDFALARTAPPDPTRPQWAQAASQRYQECDAAEHTAQGYSRSPDYGDFWIERDYLRHAAKVRVPVLVAHGWQDYNVKQSEGVDFHNALPVDRPRTKKVEGVPFKQLYVWQAPHAAPDGDAWDTMLSRFLERTLEGAANGVERDLPVISQPSKPGAGEQDLEKLASWPPPRTGPVTLQLERDAAGGVLTPVGEGEARTAGFTDLSSTTEEGALESPESEASWLWFQSEPLAADTRIAGSPLLHAVVSVETQRAQLDATLVDIAPDGTRTPVSRGFMDLRYRMGLTNRAPIVPGEELLATVRLAPQDLVVAAGHRLGLLVAGSNTAWALPDDPGATFTLGFAPGAQAGSRLELPVVGAAPPEKPKRKKKKKRG